MSIHTLRQTARVFNPLARVLPLHAVWLSDPLWTNPGDGQLITSLRNVSGGGDPVAAGTARPTFRATNSLYNNLPTAQFDGVDDWLAISLASIAGGWKFVLVGGFTSIIPTGTPMIFGNGAATAGGFGATSGALIMSGGATVLPSSTQMDAAPHVVVGDINAGTSELYLDGFLAASGTTSSSTWTRWHLGGGGTTTAASLGPSHVAFLGIYPPATSTASLLTLGAALKTMYNVPLTFTSTSTNWVCPVGVTSVLLQGWGDGGGSSSRAAGSGRGGGGGSFWTATISGLTPGNTYTINIGQGGAAATSTGDGGDGSGVSFLDGATTLFYADGGKGGIRGGGTGALGGQTSNNLPVSGGSGYSGGNAGAGQGGGGSAGDQGAGGNGVTATAGVAGSGINGTAGSGASGTSPTVGKAVGGGAGGANTNVGANGVGAQGGRGELRLYY